MNALAVHRGLALLHLGRDAEAQKEFDKFLKLDSKSKESLEGEIKAVKESRKAEPAKQP